MNYKGQVVKFIKYFDTYGKEPKLYYNGAEKYTSTIGGLFSILYGLIYLTYLLYKLIKFFKKTDFMFYDTFSYKENDPPSIQLSRNNFYGGFALENATTYDPIIDETIYYPKAFFKIRDRRGATNWREISSEPIELVRCNISNFGEFFQNKFKDIKLNNLYCLKEVNQTLMGHFSYDVYSYFYIQFFPCKNTTENNNSCKPKEVINSYLRGTFLCMEFQDIELAPQNYSIPIVPRNQDIYFKIGIKLFQDVHVYYQIINIETDEEYIGIDEFQKLRKEQYLKYHSMYQMPVVIENDIYENKEPFCDITIKLFDQIRTQTRTYTKLLEIWGDVGGAMEVISLFFNIISSFPIDILYELTIVNDLFNFDINNKKIYIKEIDIR